LAIRALWTDTHNLAEGAGAAALAAALQDKPKIRGKRVGLILSGGNIDFDLFNQWVFRIPPSSPATQGAGCVMTITEQRPQMLSSSGLTGRAGIPRRTCFTSIAWIRRSRGHHGQMADLTNEIMGT